jgi:pimeloyl-ACP methyl ester carboxylesterase
VSTARALEAGGLAVREWGSADAEPLVFLHGLGPSGPGVVDAAAPVWAADYGFRVLAPALPGFGESTPGDPAHALPSDLARVVQGTLDELGVDRFAAVGFSWGGTIGCRIPARRLTALALLDVGYQSERGEPPSLDERRKETADADFVGAEFAAAALHGTDREPPSGSFGDLRAARVPVLLLAATEPLVERRGADLARFRAALPHADVREIAGADHNLLASAPAETTAAVGEWLRSLGEPLPGD